MSRQVAEWSLSGETVETGQLSFAERQYVPFKMFNNQAVE
jgi:hypothetical protein